MKPFTLDSAQLLVELVKSDAFLQMLRDLAEYIEQDTLIYEQETAIQTQNPMSASYAAGKLAQLKRLPEELVKVARQIEIYLPKQ